LLFAAWDWPDPSPSTWSEAEQLKVCAQIHTALTERCTVVNVTWPTNVETYTCYGGYSNTVYTNDGVVWTGKTILTKSVTVTNAYGPFQYTYTDPQGTFTATGFPTVTHSMLSTLLNKTKDILPRFVDTNVLGNAEDYFTNRVFATNYSGMSSIRFPMLTQEAIVAATGGVLFSSATNAWGITNAATAYLWYADEVPQTNHILYIGGRSNLWGKQWSSTLPHSNPNVIVWGLTNYNTQARYYWASGSPTSVTMRISGTRIWNTNAVSNVTADVVFAADEPATLTGLWQTVTSATNIAGTVATGDWIIVSLPTNLVFVTPSGTNFSRRGYWRHFATMRTLLDRMVWTTNIVTVSGWTNNWEGEAAAPVRSGPPIGTIQTNANNDYTYGWVYGSGRHTWQAAGGWLVNRLYSPPYFEDGRQCIKVSGERLFGALSPATNFNKSATFFMGACKVSDVLSYPDVSNHTFHAWTLPWQEYRYVQAWTTNLTTQTSIYPYGETNHPPEGTTCVTNIGSTVAWEIVGTTDNATAGFGFNPDGFWLLKWNVAGGFTYY
jgi:hypothetical protein